MAKKASQKATLKQLGKRKLDKAKKSTRNQIVTTFHCASCGYPFSLTHTMKAVDADLNPLKPELDRIKNRDLTFYNQISVMPCQSCIDKVLAPARAVADAIKGMVGGSDQKQLTGSQ